MLIAWPGGGSGRRLALIASTRQLAKCVFLSPLLLEIQLVATVHELISRGVWTGFLLFFFFVGVEIYSDDKVFVKVVCDKELYLVLKIQYFVVTDILKKSE